MAWVCNSSFGSRERLHERFSKHTQVLDPEWTGVRRTLALAYFKLGKSEQAIAQLRTLLEEGPDNVHARKILGEALSEKGDFDGALEEFKKALNIWPRDAALV